MSSDVALHVIYKIANAPIQPFPYPHIVVPDVFPREFYEEMRNRLPPREAFTTLKALGRTGYEQQRFVLPLTEKDLAGVPEPYRGFWKELATWMHGGPFGGPVLHIFRPFLERRFGDLNAVEFHDEALLVQDYTTYSLGPHTDAPSKVLSMLFYLPADDSRAHLGTSIYVPKNPAFKCAGGPHYKFDAFRRVQTMPYVPNTLFAFIKTDQSFHGVEPVTEPEVRRDLLLYDIRVKMQANEVESAPQPAPTKFSF